MCRHESCLLRNLRKKIYMKKNNSTPVFIPTFPPHISIFVNSLKQHTRSLPLTDSHLQANPLDYSTVYVNVFSGRPCQHSRDKGEGFPFVLPISMKELVRRQSDCITPGKGQNTLIHTFNWFCGSGCLLAILGPSNTLCEGM